MSFINRVLERIPLFGNRPLGDGYVAGWMALGATAGLGALETVGIMTNNPNMVALVLVYWFDRCRFWRRYHYS